MKLYEIADKVANKPDHLKLHKYIGLSIAEGLI